MDKYYFSGPKRLTWHPDLCSRKTLIVMELCLIESCHPFPERLVNTREKVAVREESSLTPLLLLLPLIKTQSMPIKAVKELLLFFCLSTDLG